MKKQVLLIDDDEDLTRSIQVTLENQNFKIITANNGEHGFEKLQKHKPDLLVLDVMMRTDLEGYNLLHKIKKLPEFRSMPVIMLTGMADQMGVNLASGVDDEKNLPNVHFQDKPIDPLQLADLIKELTG